MSAFIGLCSTSPAERLSISRARFIADCFIRILARPLRFLFELH